MHLCCYYYYLRCGNLSNILFRLQIQIRSVSDSLIEFDVLIWFQNIYAFGDFPIAINSDSLWIDCVTFSFNVSSQSNGTVYCTPNAQRLSSNIFEPLRIVSFLFYYVNFDTFIFAATDIRSHRFCCRFAAFNGFELCKRSIQSSGCVCIVSCHRRCDRFIKSKRRKRNNVRPISTSFAYNV